MRGYCKNDIRKRMSSLIGVSIIDGSSGADSDGTDHQSIKTSLFIAFVGFK